MHRWRPDIFIDTAIASANDSYLALWVTEIRQPRRAPDLLNELACGAEGIGQSDFDYARIVNTLEKLILMKPYACGIRGFIIHGVAHP